MKSIGGTRALAIAQAGYRRDMKALFGKMARDLAGVVTRAAGPDGTIDKRRESQVVAQAGQTVLSYFVGRDGRSAYGEDGVTPLAEYPRVLNTWIVWVSQQVVAAHQTWMARHVPEDVYAWLQTSGKRRALREYTDAERRAFLELMKALRIFHTDPLAVYEPAHTWVDPNGYRLSDRVWQNGERTRLKIDAMLTDFIRQGKSARYIADHVEGFLLPGRLGIRTNKPYGRDASADAMRLGRTEISHAHGQAAFVSAMMNPWADGGDWALSARHPKMDICDDKATLGMGGERLRDPYPLASAPVPPAHPFCLCNFQAAVSASAAEVTAKLRQAMAYGDIEPFLTPARADDFLADLLGALFSTYLIQRWAA